MIAVNRADFSGGWLAWILRSHRHDLKLRIVGSFRFGGRNAADGPEQAPIVVPIDPFESGKLNRLKRAPRTTPMDHLGFEEPDDGFCQSIDAPIEVKQRFAPGNPLRDFGTDSRKPHARRSA